jgi:diguanylate cyclase (GGDEF)-like protein
VLALGRMVVTILDGNMEQNKKNNIIYFVISFALVFSLSFLVLFFLEKEVRTTKVEALQNQERRVVTLENDFLGREFSMVLSDLHYLHQAYENELLYSSNYTKVAANWSEFSTQRRIYDQIRYLNANGDEKIRINISENGGFVVPEKDLQNKKDRYYFTETVKLNENGVYISPLDLNIEQGEIEIPYKPMIRLSTPIYDDKGKLQGIIVLNYLADSLLSGFRDLAKNSQGEIILINANGYRLSSSDPENDWNFMFDEKKENTFKREFPIEWKSIVENKSQFTTKEGLVTATPVVLSHKFNADKIRTPDQQITFGDGSWYIVSIIERTQKNGEIFNDNVWAIVANVFLKNIYFFVLIGIISGIVGFLVYVNRKTYNRIKYYSEFDPLTKTFNRRAGIAKLNELFPSDDRRQFLVSLCFIDINGLKQVNDTLGHKMGDELITTVAEIIKRRIREQDFLVRLGGDEFLIVFNGIGIDLAEKIWERITQEYNQINQNEDRAYIISVSHGIVDFENKQKTHVDDLIIAADEKMYLEKQIMKAKLSVIKETKRS